MRRLLLGVLILVILGWPVGCGTPTYEAPERSKMRPPLRKPPGNMPQ
jgi:hypothetical protein